MGEKLANAFAKCFEATGAEAVEIVANETAAAPPATAGPVVVNRKRCKGRKCKRIQIVKDAQVLRTSRTKLDLRWKVNNLKFLYFLTFKFQMIFVF